MSAIGTKRTCRSPNRMSAFGGRADVSHGVFYEYTPKPEDWAGNVSNGGADFGERLQGVQRGDGFRKGSAQPTACVNIRYLRTSKALGARFMAVALS
jgi:hypothetical protein